MSDGAETTGAAAIFRAVCERICTLELPFGAVLREVELAREFGVSRTPVRQALHQLAAFGLVETRNGVGTLVTAGDPETLADIYELRIRLAGLIGELATGPCPSESADAMRAVQARAEALPNPPGARAFWQVNEDRHEIVNALIANRELRGLHDLYYFKVAPFWFALYAEAPEREFTLLLREIREMVFWLEQGDMKAVANMQENNTAMAARRVAVAFGQGKNEPDIAQ
ncbi:MAG: GntR family transcriptional regulator [Roseovarius sp.]|uniref:GntR family transcriptional regulator n=1 Tax=Roseovarius sp. TaxID=1486281 RepID=UPI0032ECDA42